MSRKNNDYNDEGKYKNNQSKQKVLMSKNYHKEPQRFKRTNETVYIHVSNQNTNLSKKVKNYRRKLLAKSLVKKQTKSHHRSITKTQKDTLFIKNPFADIADIIEIDDDLSDENSLDFQTLVKFFLPKLHQKLPKSPEVGFHPQAGLPVLKEKSTKINVTQVEEDTILCKTIGENIEDNLKLPNKELEEIMNNEIKEQDKFSGSICKDVNQICTMLDNLLNE